MGPKNLLALLPLPGFVLRENTTYAAVVMKKLGDEAGRPLKWFALVDEYTREALALEVERRERAVQQNQGSCISGT